MSFIDQKDVFIEQSAITHEPSLAKKFLQRVITNPYLAPGIGLSLALAGCSQAGPEGVAKDFMQALVAKDQAKVMAMTCDSAKPSMSRVVPTLESLGANLSNLDDLVYITDQKNDQAADVRIKGHITMFGHPEDYDAILPEKFENGHWLACFTSQSPFLTGKSPAQAASPAKPAPIEQKPAATPVPQKVPTEVSRVTEVTIPNADKLVGNWENTGDNQIPQVYIYKVGNKLMIRVWGGCKPVWCEWGESQITYNGQITLAKYSDWREQNELTFEILSNGEQLKIHDKSRQAANSERNSDIDQLYKRSQKPIPTPANIK